MQHNPSDVVQSQYYILLEKTDGHDAVYCEGDCQGWMHRQCAGLSRFAFDKLGESIPYLCSYCTLNKQYKEICSLKDTVETLTNRIVELESACRSNVSQPAAAQVIQTQSSVNSTPVTNKQVTDKSTIPPKPPQITPEKKFNLIFYGITESPVNTPRTNRQQHDLQNILSTLSTIDSSLTSSLIKDFHRLGKFSASKPSPRPILVKFLRTFEVEYVLSKRSLLEHPASIKPDMPRDERASEAAFLKERWNLAQRGVDRKSIKLRNGHIYIDNTLYGKLEKSNNGFYTVIRTSTQSTSTQGTTGDNNNNPTQSSSSNISVAAPMELHNDSPSQ